MKIISILFFILFPLLVNSQSKFNLNETEVLVIGGGVGGTAAAIQSARSGVKTVLVEPTNMLGGMLTAAGVSCTDGNNDLPGGMWGEFRQALQKHYNKKWLNTGWVSWTCFEPHVGDSIFKAWAFSEKNLLVFFNHHFSGVIKEKNSVKGAIVKTKEGKIIRIKSDVVIDGTELGDVFAKAGAGYDLGMDDPAESGEKEAREKNNIIQDLTWAAILKDYGKDADKTIPKPLNYDATKYYCCCTDAPCTGTSWNGDKWKMLNYGKLPRSPGTTTDKYMLNWPPHGNDFYLNVVEDDEDTRIKGYANAKEYTLGFIYFIQTELGMKHIGLADDELDAGMALIPYNREGRRVNGIVRMNISHIKDPYKSTLYRTGIAVGDYPIDHHHAQYPGKVPGIEFPPIPSFNVPMGTLIPEEIDGLIVCEKGISVTNIVNGTTRLQPVVLLTGQAAGVLAAKSVKEKKRPREISVRAVQEELLKLKCYLMSFVDVKMNDPAWESIQRVGLTGILKGRGKSEGWANKTFFYPDSMVNGSEYYRGLREYAYFGNTHRIYWTTAMSISNSIKILKRLRTFMLKKDFEGIKSEKDFENHWYKCGLSNFNLTRPITRRELAVLLDKSILLFGSKNLLLDINGKRSFRVSNF